jgi:hypothetical protein
MEFEQFPQVDEDEHFAVLHDIFSSVPKDKGGKVPLKLLMKKLEKLGMQEEDLRNFEERCSVMDMTEVRCCCRCLCPRCAAPLFVSGSMRRRQ